MRAALSRRLAHAFAVGFPTAAERDRVVQAVETTRAATFGDLPPDVRELVLRLEQGPR